MKNIFNWFFEKTPLLSDKTIMKLQEDIFKLEDSIVDLSRKAHLITDAGLAKRMQRAAQDWYKDLLRTKYYLFMRFVELGGDVYDINNDLPTPVNKVGLTVNECDYFIQKSLLENAGVKTSDSYKVWKKSFITQ